MPNRIAVKQGCMAAKGYEVRYYVPLNHFSRDDAVADTAWLNRWIEHRIRGKPAQYLWVHKRFKTRPEGEAGLYE